MTNDGDQVALTIIVPVYNGADTLAEQLDALCHQQWSGSWEVLIVDNASTDATPQIAARFAAAHPDLIRTIEAPRVHNLSYVRNSGAAAAHGRTIAFCDADDVVGPDWVSAIGCALHNHPLVGSRLEYDKLNSVDGSGASRFGSEGIATMFGLPCVSGAGLGCQTWLWDALGGNDEAWDSTGEDFEFSMRAARDEGIQPFFAKDAIYHYRLRSGAKATFRQNRRYGRSHVRLFQSFGSPEHRSPVLASLRHTVALCARIGDLLRPDRRVRWARSAGKRLGRIEGTLRYRTLYL